MCVGSVLVAKEVPFASRVNDDGTQKMLSTKVNAKTDDKSGII